MSKLIEQLDEDPLQYAPVDIPDGTWNRDKINARVEAQQEQLRKAYNNPE